MGFKDYETNYIYVLVLIICILSSLYILWLNFPSDVDLKPMNDYCKLYSESSHIEIEYIKDEKYIKIKDIYILEEELKTICINTPIEQ